MTVDPLITIAVPSFNQGRYLDAALASIFAQDIPVEVFVADGGSTDGSLDVIRKWEPKLSAWRSRADDGQAAAINESIALGRAPFVCWLNSDDYFEPHGLATLLQALHRDENAAAAYGRAWNLAERTGAKSSAWNLPFDERHFAVFCFISQPATLIRRHAWDSVGGLDPSLHMAMDYDLWWRLHKQAGALNFVDEFVATNREHSLTKTRTQRRRHYREAIAVVRKYYGRVPLKWWIAQPYSVWWRSITG